jgi:threonine dehydrogenase-like Zn-dependent dehydrogenase
VKALVFGAPPGPDEKRPTPTDDRERFLLSLPFGLHIVDDAHMVGPDWVLTRPILSGICGSDAKLVMGDFGEGDVDNPMSAFSSLPHVPGHEVVAEVVEVGPRAEGVEIGDRVVLNPWLTCAPRGVDPVCPACAAGNLSLCWSFTSGRLGPGVHVGVTTDAPGAWAQLLAAHDSMLIPVPDGISDEVAVLADPFAVSMHAILRHPPPPGGRALVYGAGALGVTSVAALRCLYPDVEVAVVARFAAQEKLVTRLGAAKVVAHEPHLAVVEELAAWSGGVLHSPFDGLPVAHPGGIDVVYDTVGTGQTAEVGVRLLKSRGTMVKSGVNAPERWEWSPLYFKEISWVGSNAFGVEEVDGERLHGIEHYLRFVADGRVDLTGMLTHTFRLDQWREAFTTLATQQETGAVKVAFDFR